MRRATLLLLPVLALLGCGRKAVEEVVPVGEPVSVEVKNNHALSVRIDVEGNGTRYHLGTVHPGMNASYKIPRNVTAGGTAEIFVVSSDRSRPFSSGILQLAPGAVVDVVVQSRIFNSTATIRP